jgi:hypothetical protein
VQLQIWLWVLYASYFALWPDIFDFQPIYISEISPAAIRGRLIGLYELGWQIGAVVGFFINYVRRISMKIKYNVDVLTLWGRESTYTYPKATSNG